MMTLANAAQHLGAQLVGADVRFTSVSTDSRKIESGALFVALRGERYDGHEYIEAARAGGAVAALASRAAPEGRATQLPLLLVDDTRLALGALAKHWRTRFNLPVIAVTGSNGKTTVKEMIAAMLREHFGATQVLATRGNLNNDIGLPLTLLELCDAHACAVVELGMNHAGETAYLADLARPTVALVNNAQREHQEFMSSVAEVAAEHAAVYTALPADGIAVINSDDAYAADWRAMAEPRSVRDFGITRPAMVSAGVKLHAGESELDIVTPEGRATVSLPLPGVHNARNALAAVAAATAVGVELAQAAHALAAFRAVKGRLQPKLGRHGAAIIDDTYNANPDSVRAAIDVLSRAAPPRVLILGDMGEVGTQGPAFHDEIGRYAKDAGIEHLLGVGALARHATAAFGGGGEHFRNVESIATRACSLLMSHATVLVKGSRFMRMERVVEQLVAGENHAA